MSNSVTPCFVIMPFSKTSEEHTERYWAEHFEDFLKPIIEESKEFKAFRSEPLRANILKDIIKELVACPVVLADITNKNANVFLELGIRQSFKHGTIIIAQKGTKIPFDISMKSVLYYYPKNHLKYGEFKNKLQKALKDYLKNPDRPDSIVLETISGRGSLYEIIHRDEALRRITALLSEIRFNKTLFKNIYEIIEENKNKKREDYQHQTGRFRNSAIDLLVNNRYLDIDESFYGLAENLHLINVAMNTQLTGWAINRNVEQWFLKDKIKFYNDMLQTFNKKLEEHQKRLKTTC